MRGKSAEKGTVLVFVALMLPFLVFFAGMGIDVGRAYLYKSHMQNAADAAALAGVEKAGGLKGRLVRSGEVPLNSNI
ncbi:MAG: Tad domain-containing protein, partial [Selenomonas sp.]|nr:Tad domain-containing protein [Selenomonas sp.]